MEYFDKFYYVNSEGALSLYFWDDDDPECQELLASGNVYTIDGPNVIQHGRNISSRL